MTDKLPPNLLALFAPRPPLKYLEPVDHAPEQRRTAFISGMADFLHGVKDSLDQDGYKPTESHMQRKDKIKQDIREAHKKHMEEGVSNYKPSDDPNVKGDAYKTLFVSRLSYDATEEDLKGVFGQYGSIDHIRIVKNNHAPENASKKKKIRGYAFIVYKREGDMKEAYKNTDGIMIKGRKCVVDVERGRTVAAWRPRAFGGGLGGRHYTKAPAVRPMGSGFGPPNGPGGFRGGGFRGGFQGGRGGGFQGGGGRGGGFRGGFQGGGGGRGGIGYQGNGFGGPPDGAPAGPRGGGRGGFASGGGGYGRDRGDDRRGGGGGGGGGGGFGSGSGSNREPVGPRGGYRDRDSGRENGYGDQRNESRKRPFSGGGDDYDHQSSRRRY